MASTELMYGYRHEWLNGSDSVALALAKVKKNLPMSPLEEELALLLSDEFDRIPSVMGSSAVSCAAQVNPSSVWLFLALAWLHEHRADHEKPFDVVDQIYADFDYADEIASLVSFMPAPSGVPLGYQTLKGRWLDYLNQKVRWYRLRELE